METLTAVELDKSQAQFCESSADNIRLLAPAGSGKTLSLAHRCRHLLSIADSTSPRFLAVTFTRAAKDEFTARLSDDPAFRGLSGLVEVTTLNAWGYRRLRNEAFNPRLLSGRDKYHFAMLNQLQPVWKDHKAVREVITAKKNIVPRQIMNLIDGFKSIGFDHTRDTNLARFERHVQLLREHGLSQTWEKLVVELGRLNIIPKRTKNGDEHVECSPKVIYNAFFRFWRDASQHLIDSDTFTLEDQKYFAYLDEKSKLESGKLLSGATRYNHLLVDEFQDINPLDLALLRSIADRNQSTITIVGDDDQAIFEWRGASPKFIVSPDKYFDRVFKTYTLDVNYRCPRNIVSISQRLIGHNVNRVEKSLSAKLKHDAKITVSVTSDLSDAMSKVVAECELAANGEDSSNRVAVIGRKRSQIIPYQLYFAANNISFCAAEDLHVFLSKTFDRLMKLIEIKCGADQRLLSSQVVESVIDLCNLVKRYPLSKKDRDGLKSFLVQGRPKSVVDAVRELARYDGQLKGKNKDCEMSLQFADSIRRFFDASDVSQSLNVLADAFSGLQADLGKAEDDVFYVDPPFLHLAEYARRYGDNYGEFIDDIELAREQLVHVPPFDPEDDSCDDQWNRPVHLMTAQRSKGKEFGTVVLLDANEGVWPSKHAESTEEIEAERRVFYVAFTRVKKRLLILVNKAIRDQKAEPSRFLTEADLI